MNRLATSSNRRSARPISLAFARAILIVAGACAPLLPVATGTAQAQEIFQFGPEGAGAQPAAFSRDDVARYGAMLGFDEAQREAALALYDGMIAEQQEAAAKLRESIANSTREAREGNATFRLDGDFATRIRDQIQARQAREDSFVADLRALATDAQAERWAGVERAIRRDRSLPRGRLAGERVDLVKIAAELSPPGATASPDVASILARYEAEIDRAIVERDKRAAEMRGVARGDENAQALREKANEAREALRDVNRKYARQIAAALPEQEAAKFTQAVAERSYPQIYGPSHASKSLDAALKMDDLTAEQRQTIEALRDGYARDARRANEQWAKAQEAWEQTPMGAIASMLPADAGSALRLAGPDGVVDDPTQAVRDARVALDGGAIEKLRAVLTDAQRERLPKPAERRRGGLSPRGFEAGGPGELPGGSEGPRVLIMEGSPDMIPEGAPGTRVNVMRRVTIGPDGKPVETTETHVEPFDGASDTGSSAVEIEIGPAPSSEPKPE